MLDLSFLRLNKDEAERIPNKTVPFPGDPGYYAVGLAVFHQLHCLVRPLSRLPFLPTQ